MSDTYLEITRREEFCAAHRLHDPRLSEAENRELYGICNNPHGHGHNYAIEVTVRGRVPDSTGIVLDLLKLSSLVREEIVSRVDHRHLNHDVAFLDGVNPTAENLAVAFWARLAPRISDFPGCALVRVRLYESRDSFVDYRG